MDQLQEQDIPGIILLGTLGMLLLIGGLGLFILLYQKRILKEKQKRAMQELDYQNQMIKLQLESQEQERKRIGADLHDSLGSLLWGAKVNASFIQKSVEMDEHAATSYRELTQILDESIESVRRIAWELTPEAFHYSGLSASVSKLCDRLDGKGGIEISFKEEDSRLWNDDRALQVFRVIQELISNALKHSGASSLEISIRWLEHLLKVDVVDNGTGFKTAEKKGVGLWNVNQRVKQLNGKISIGNPPTSTGVEICLEIPLTT